MARRGGLSAFRVHVATQTARLISYKSVCEPPASDNNIDVQGGILGFSIEIHLTCSSKLDLPRRQRSFLPTT